MKDVFQNIVDTVNWSVFLAAFIILIVWNKTMPQIGYCSIDCYTAIGFAFVGALIIKAVRKRCGGKPKE